MYSGINLSECCFVHHNPTPGSKPGLRGDRPATNRLSHGTARRMSYVVYVPCLNRISEHLKTDCVLSELHLKAQLIVCVGYKIQSVIKSSRL